MNLGGKIQGFAWNKYGFLLDSGYTGATNSVLKFLIDYSWEIAFVLGMVALAYEIIRIMSSKNAAIHMVILKISLAIILISYYEPLCKTAIICVDNVTEIITETTAKNMENMYLKIAEEKKVKTESWYKRIFGKKNPTIEEIREVDNNAYFNPFELSLINFNPLKFIASLLLIFCQVAIFLVSKFRNIILALLLLIGRICIVGFICEKTEQIAKGWLMSFINVLFWTVWLSIILNLQYVAGFGNVYFKSSNPLDMIEDIADCIVYLVLYLQVFNLSKEMLSGSLGSAASSLGSAVGLGFAAKGIMEGTQKGIAKQSFVPPYSQFLSSVGGSGLSQMDSSTKPVSVNSDSHYLPGSPKQIDVGNTPLLPEPPKVIELGGPVIDADYK